MTEPFDLAGPLVEQPLLLEASAGTGKTYSVAHLFTRLVVEAELPVDRILVVTFTEAATAELRDRVRKRLREARTAVLAGHHETDPNLDAWVRARAEHRDHDAARLQDALLGFDLASISTIHGFCRRMLLRHAFESGAEFDVHLEKDQRDLYLQVAHDWLHRTLIDLSPGDERALGDLKKPSYAWRIVQTLDNPDLVLTPKAPDADTRASWPVPRRAIYDLADFTRARLEEVASRRHTRSFDDLLRALRDALEDGPCRERLKDAVRAQYAAALIDEFQDTDPVQWSIFSTLWDAGRLYLIGDPKQAIYSFRGADLNTYLAARKVVPTATQRLDTNFRSDGNLVAAVNHLFGGHAQPFFDPRIAYEPVKANRDAINDAPLRLRFVPGAHREDVERILAKDLQATLAAHPAKDHAVLVRTNDEVRRVQAALGAAGIRSVVRGAVSVFATPEAEDLQHLLAAMSDPGDAGRVRRALVTRVVGMRAEDLVELDHTEDAWERWVGLFRELDGLWRTEGFVRAFRQLLADLKVPERALARVGGERQMTNLLHLAELAHTAAVRGRLTPPALLSWLAGRRDDAGDDDEEQLRLESDADAVDILTLHKAKGLQWPVVWLPFVSAGTGLFKSEEARIAFHRPEGGRFLHVGTEGRHDALEQARTQKRAEAMRVLYVGLTRAEEFCHVYCGRLTKQWQTSPLAWLLHCRAHTDYDAGLRRARRLQDPGLQADLEAIADGSGGTIAVNADEPASGERTETKTDDTPLRARPWTRAHVDALWRRTSFSGMTRGDHHGPLPVADHDEVDPEAEDDEAPVAPASDAEIPLHDFVAGARVGTCLHEILEVHDFLAPAALQGVVAEKMSAHGVEGDPDRVAAALDRALAAPFSGALRLQDIPVSDRLDELEFTFAVAGGESAGALAVDRETLASHYDAHGRPEEAAALRGLGFEPVRGFLTGSIDLVFRAGNRWSLVDYKSNFLGTTFADYAPAKLATAMRERRYFLQAHLYAVALHRYLEHRLPDYDYDRHFGGVGYLFLRGMDPDHPGCGVYAESPDRAFVVGLSDLLGSGR